MRELLERLCALNAVSSWEDEVRAFLLAEVEPHADRLRVDALGNLIAWKKGRKHTGSKLLLTAHMDEVGLMIRQITDDGYLKFDTVGAIDRRVLLGKPVLVGPKRVPGWWDSRPTIWSAGRRRSPSPSWTSSISTSEPGTGPGRRRRSLWEIRRPLTVTPETSGRACSRERRWGAGWAAPCCSPSCGMNCPWTVPLSLPPRRRWGPAGPSARPSPSPRRWRWWWTARMLRIWPECRPQAGMQLGRRCGAALYGSGRYCRPGAL